MRTIKSNWYFLLFPIFALVFSFNAHADEKAWLGLGLSPISDVPILADHLGLKDGRLVVCDIVSGGPAEAYGIRRGDVIESIDDLKIINVKDFADYVVSKAPGTVHTLNIIRNGRPSSVKITSRARPQTLNERDFGENTVFPDNFGGNDIKGNFGRKLFYRTQFQSDKGLEICSVTIDGDPEDGESLATVDLSGQQYRSKLKDISKLPEPVRNAVKEAIERGPKMGFFAGAEEFDEIFRKNLLEMEKFRQEFENSFKRNQPNHDKRNKNDGGPIRIIEEGKTKEIKI